MSTLAQVHCKPSPCQVTVGAEGIAAAQFARCGFDVTVQSGRDKPAYDLVVAKAGYLLKVVVNGSEDGSWALTQAFLKGAPELIGTRANCHSAIDSWLDRHGSRMLCCLVQFQGVSIDQLPRIYLATPLEIAQKLRETADRVGTSTLYERYEWTPGTEKSPAIETLPSAWAFSEDRILDLLTEPAPAAPKPMVPHRGPSPLRAWPVSGKTSFGTQRAVAFSA